MTKFIPPEIWKWHTVLVGIIPEVQIQKFECLADSFIFILMKTKHPVHIMVFEMVSGDSDVMLPFIFQNCLRLNTGQHKVPEGGNVALYQEGGCWKTLSGNKTLHQAIQAGELFAMRKFL